jgi:hypothetical protein
MTRPWSSVPRRYRASYRPCPSCGGPMARHARECRRCSTIARGEAHVAWKGADANDTTKRSRADNVRRSGPCEECGSPGVDRHHRDGDPGNNEASNIALLCRRCHMLADGRLQRLAAAPRPIKPAQPCNECGRLYKPLRRGLCHACNERARRAARRAERAYGITYQRGGTT